MKTIPVATFNTRDGAERLLTVLQEVGIHGVLKDESKLERFWFMSEPLAAFHVEVPVAHYLVARGIIADLDEEGEAMRSAVYCPDCGSSLVEFPQISRKFLMPVLEAVLMAVHIMPRKFYCLECHYTWPKESPREPELDLLGWPRAQGALKHPEYRR